MALSLYRRVYINVLVMCILANVNLMFVHWYLYIWLWAGAKLTASIIPASTF